ncbi:MAG TPA: hypothetical protein V6C99_02545 [Oculatellaceae cyanobacterium]|jgi:hypothetical protein
MSFSKAFKIFQLNVLRQAGVAITPEQVGLKSDPILDLQAKNLTNSTFSTLLSRLGMSTPVAPTLPEDTSDTEAMKTYHQQMLAYSQNLQLYNQRFMQLMLNQMQQMQQVLAQQRSSAVSGSTGTSSVDSGSLGVGGIL